MKVSMVPLCVLQHRPKVQEVFIDYPMIALKDWAAYLLNHHPHILLGGCSIDDVDTYTHVYSEFWQRYYVLDREHPFFEHHHPDEWGRCLPFCLHGDEGRGKGKTPILINSFQMVVGPAGIDHTNMSGKLGLFFRKLSTMSCVFLPKVHPSRCSFLPTMSMVPRPRSSLCTRLLASMMPATMYAKNDRTLDSMAKFVVDDLTECFYTGVEESKLKR